MNYTDKAMLEELLKEDSALTEANRDLRLARLKFDLATARYAAVRDLFLQRTGKNPYAQPNEFGNPDFASEGRFRFAGMSVGDALIQVFKEKKEPLRLEQIVAAMHAGGLPSQPRSVNAALMQTRGVEKLEGERYRYIDPEEPDDLPFA